MAYIEHETTDGHIVHLPLDTPRTSSFSEDEASMIANITRTVQRDMAMGSELRRRINAQEFSGELLYVAWDLVYALSRPPNHIDGYPAKRAIKSLAKHGLSPMVFGVSPTALREARLYERYDSAFQWPGYI